MIAGMIVRLFGNILSSNIEWKAELEIRNSRRKVNDWMTTGACFPLAATFTLLCRCGCQRKVCLCLYPVWLSSVKFSFMPVCLIFKNWRQYFFSGVYIIYYYFLCSFPYCFVTHYGVMFWHVPLLHCVTTLLWDWTMQSVLSHPSLTLPLFKADDFAPSIH